MKKFIAVPVAVLSLILVSLAEEANSSVKYSELAGKKIKSENGKLVVTSAKGASQKTYKIKSVVLDPTASESIGKETSYVLMETLDSKTQFRLYFDPAAIIGRGKEFVADSKITLELDKSGKVVDYSLDSK